MRRFWVVLHIVLGLAWMCTALTLGMKTALLGNEEAVLGKQHGEYHKRRNELAPRSSHLRSAIDWHASSPVLGEAVRRLALPLADRSGGPIAPPQPSRSQPPAPATRVR